MKNKIFETIEQEVPADDSTSYEEKIILYEEIKKLKPKVIVEVGTHRGLTTLFMAQAVIENKIENKIENEKGHIYTCDPNNEWGQTSNFAKFPEHNKVITYLQTKGKDLEIEEIDFLFLDGFHEKHFVIEEVNSLFPKLSKNAVVYFHDTNERNPLCDVTGAIEELGLKVEYLKTQNGMAVFRK